MKTQHTPGPWSRNISPAAKYPTIYAGRNTHIARVMSAGLTEEETEANCNLVKSAPCLLALAATVAEFAEIDAEDNDDTASRRRLEKLGAMSRAVIAKAT